VNIIGPARGGCRYRQGAAAAVERVTDQGRYGCAATSRNPSRVQVEKLKQRQISQRGLAAYKVKRGARRSPRCKGAPEYPKREEFFAQAGF